MAGRDTYDIDPLQREILEHRAARRQKLRYEYLKETENPYRMATGEGGFVEDVAINRYQAMRVTVRNFFRPTTKNSFWILMVSVIPIGLSMWTMKIAKTRQETQIRTGQVSYRDRDYKFK